MSRSMRIFSSVLTVFMLVTAVAGAQSRHDGDRRQAADLFKPLSLKFDLTPQQQKRLDELRKDPTSGEIKLFRVKLEVPKTADAINFNFVPGGSLQLDTRSRVDRAPDDYSWSGADLQGRASAVLVVKDGLVVGTVRSGDKLYRVRPVGEGVHAVIEVNQQAFPPEHPPSHDRPPARGDALPSGPPPASAAAVGAADVVADACPIDVLIAYTSAAADEAGSIAALIQLAVDETNVSYGKSAIHCRLRLVHAYQTSYTETGDVELDLARFQSPQDGFMDEVHGLRDEHAADVAVLITSSLNFCGMASEILARPDTAFAVVKESCATGYYSFGHEIGHLQGARHNPEVDDTATPFAYGHGFFSAAIRKRTVMSYDCPVGCTRVDLWAGPTNLLDGIAMGSASTHHDARVLDETACTLAGFRSGGPAVKISLRPLAVRVRAGDRVNLEAVVEAAGLGRAGVPVAVHAVDGRFVGVSGPVTTNAAGVALVPLVGRSAGTTRVVAEAEGISATAEVRVESRRRVPALSVWSLLVLLAGGTFLLRTRRAV